MAVPLNFFKGLVALCHSFWYYYFEQSFIQYNHSFIHPSLFAETCLLVNFLETKSFKKDSSITVWLYTAEFTGNKMLYKRLFNYCMAVPLNLPEINILCLMSYVYPVYLQYFTTGKFLDKFWSKPVARGRILGSGQTMGKKEGSDFHVNYVIQRLSQRVHELSDKYSKKRRNHHDWLRWDRSLDFHLFIFPQSMIPNAWFPIYYSSVLCSWHCLYVNT